MLKRKTALGREIDFTPIIEKHANKIALGGRGSSTLMNARGDIVNTRGEILQKKEDIALEYHKGTTKTVKNVSIKDLADEMILKPSDITWSKPEIKTDTTIEKKKKAVQQ